MTTLSLVSLYAMAAIYIVAGIFHFIKPKVFISITPNWVPKPELVNILVGIAEILLAIGLLFEKTRSEAAIGIIILLIVVFPANVKHYLKAKRKGVFVIPTLIRLPLQLLLIYWASMFV